MKKEARDELPEDEAQRRFDAIVRAVLSTPPKPMKDIPRKRPYRPRERKASVTEPKSAEPSA